MQVRVDGTPRYRYSKAPRPSSYCCCRRKGRYTSSEGEYFRQFARKHPEGCPKTLPRYWRSGNGSSDIRKPNVEESMLANGFSTWSKNFTGPCRNPVVR